MLLKDLVRTSLMAIMLAAGAAAPAAAAEPTFEQVMAQPDNVPLNYEYARAEAGKGNLLSAAAAMERVVDAQPRWGEARLFYVGVLYKLDDAQDARGQLKQLEGLDLTPEQRNQADRFRQQVGDWGRR